MIMIIIILKLIHLKSFSQTALQFFLRLAESQNHSRLGNPDNSNFIKFEENKHSFFCLLFILTICQVQFY